MNESIFDYEHNECSIRVNFSLATLRWRAFKCPIDTHCICIGMISSIICICFVFCCFSSQESVRVSGLSEIASGLYLCGAGIAIPIFLEKLGITCVINAAPELPDTPLPQTSPPIYLQIPVLDKSDTDLSSYFDEVSDLIHQVRESNGKCMVHCVAGVSRSASLCLAYMMKHMKMTLKDAFHLVRSVRYDWLFGSDCHAHVCVYV